MFHAGFRRRTEADGGMGGARLTVPVGIVFSTTGSYAALGRDQQDGTLLAIETVNANPSFDVTLVPSVVDPAGSLDRLRRAAMSARTSVEALCASVAASPALAAQLPAPPPPAIPAIIDRTRVP